MITLRDLETDYREQGHLADTYDSGWVSFSAGHSTICLDGHFTIEELKAFVTFMEGWGGGN